MKSVDPMNNIESLAAFQLISNLTGEMAEAGRAGEWDKLAELERDCATIVAQLRTRPPARLMGEKRRQKIELIQKILANDADIRCCTEPWMKRLETLLGNARRARQLGKAYDCNM
jgi:flagellar protein FliT